MSLPFIVLKFLWNDFVFDLGQASIIHERPSSQEKQLSTSQGAFGLHFWPFVNHSHFYSL